MKSSVIKSLITIVTPVVLAATIAQAEVKIGIVGPLSGSSLNVGGQQEIGAQKAVAHLNAKGGVLGQKIVAISVDGACKLENAKTVANRLIREGIVFVVGHGCSGSAVAASKIYEKADVVMIAPTSTNPKLTDESGPNIFRITGRDDQQGVIAGNYLADNFANSKIAIIHDGTTYGLDLAQFTKNQLNKRGVTEVLFEAYKPNQKDYSIMIKKLVAAKADVLYAGGYQGDIGNILRQAKKSIPRLRLFSGDTLVDVEFLITSEGAGEGSYFTAGPDMRLKPEAATVVKAIRDENFFEPEGFTLYSYAAVQAWAQAVEKAGTFQSDAVIRALKTGQFDTVLGKIGFDEKGDVTGISTFVWYVFRERGYVLAE